MHKTYIIGEAGCNHNGNLKNAYILVDIAKNCGLSAVKFQIFNPELLVTKNATKAEYATKNTRKSETQYKMQKKISLSYISHLKIKQYCEKKKIDYLCSVFDEESLEFVKKIKIKKIKIPSGEINNIPLLKKISKLSCDIILSTGMSTNTEIKDAIKIFKKKIKNNRFHLLHCISSYPTKIDEINLNSIPFLKKKFKCNVGFSDHTLSTLIPALAVAKGAKIIEKHFTLNKKMKGPDHFMSLDKKELKVMVKNISVANRSLGQFSKIVGYSEKKNLKHARKSIYARINILKGEKFTEKNLVVKRPGTGLEPKLISKIIGKISKRNFKPDQKISL